jgi:hypothetical protein
MFAPEGFAPKAFTPKTNVAPTRRVALLSLGGIAATGWTRLFAGGADFWNKKDPSEWSGEEVNQLTTKSPWAKEVSSSYTPSGGRGPASSTPDGGGLGGHRSREIPGIPSQPYKGTIRWESAKPVMDALKAPLAEVFADHYVISVTGFPVTAFGGGKPRSGSNASMEDVLDHLKGITFLQAKDKRDVQPGIVQQPPAGTLGTTILFGFSKEIITLTPDDKEVVFVTEFGRLGIKAKFNLKEMLYRGELAI